LLLVAFGGQGAPGPSLAEIARREKERREALHKEGRAAAKVIRETDLSTEGDWTGWRVWRSPDGGFELELPSRPSLEIDELAIGGGRTVKRTMYTASDEIGRRYTVAVADYPRDYARTYASQIWGDFQTRDHLPFAPGTMIEMNSGAQLGGRTAWVMRGHYAQLVGLLIGARFYQLMITAGPKDGGIGWTLAPFFDTFRPLL
jgi:hypothetical protein